VGTRSPVRAEVHRSSCQATAQTSDSGEQRDGGQQNHCHTLAEGEGFEPPGPWRGLRFSSWGGRRSPAAGDVRGEFGGSKVTSARDRGARPMAGREGVNRGVTSREAGGWRVRTPWSKIGNSHESRSR
jgi:hypothetical protein